MRRDPKLTLTGAAACIGNTPLVPLHNIRSGPGLILGKCEFLQPGGSVKDRAALEVIRLAYKWGHLTPGQTVVEMTSGNMGAGLAVVCNALGHPFIATISAGNSPARVRMMRALGAEVIVVPQVDGEPGQVTGEDLKEVERKAREISDARSGYYVDQFNHPGCVMAHEHGTGPEIWSQSHKNLDGFAACVGSSGTFTGTSRFLKSVNASIFCIAVEPEHVSVLMGGQPKQFRHRIQGTGYGAVPPQFEAELMDDVILINDVETTQWRDRLAREEGLHVGYSAAANVCAADKLLRSGRLKPDARIATILCDTGFKYD